MDHLYTLKTNIKSVISDYNNPNKKKNIKKLIVLVILRIFVSISAFTLASDCTKYNNILLRTITLLVSIIFSELYIIYYSIYRVLLGNKCY